MEFPSPTRGGVRGGGLVRPPALSVSALAGGGDRRRQTLTPNPFPQGGGESPRVRCAVDSSQPPATAVTVEAIRIAVRTAGVAAAPMPAM